VPEVWIDSRFDDNGEFVDGYFTLVPDPQPKGDTEPMPSIEELLKDAKPDDVKAFVASQAETAGFVSKDWADRLRREKQAADEKLADVTGKFETLTAEKVKREKDELEAKGETQKLLEKERVEHAEALKKIEKEMRAQQRYLVKTEAARIAKEKGIIAEDLVDLIDLEKATVENGQVKGAAEAVEAYQKAKPNLFKAPESDADRKAREEREAEEKRKGGFRPPEPGTGGGGDGKVDWMDRRKATPDMVAAATRELTKPA
jgi:hypothetical protein